MSSNNAGRYGDWAEMNAKDSADASSHFTVGGDTKRCHTKVILQMPPPESRSLVFDNLVLAGL